MTISNTSRTAGPFLGNGATTIFPFTFKVFDRSDLVVAVTNIATGVETVLVLDSDYTVALNSNQNANPGGTITTTVAPATGTYLAATSNIALNQTLDLTNQGGFYPSTITNALDKVTIMVQQLAAKINGGLNVGGAALISTVTNFVGNLTASSGAGLVGFIQNGLGAVQLTIQDVLRARAVTPQQFGAKGDGVTDDTPAFVLMFALGVPWYIPKGTYKITGPLTIKSGGVCDGGQLVFAAGFAGIAVQIVNAVYGRRLQIVGLDVYSTDVRPSPYTAAKTTGILVGPNATYSGNTPCPGVLLLHCKAQRFSVDLHIATFNVTVHGGAYIQGDHNVLIYSYDTTYNQVNDVTLLDVQLDSPAAAPGKIAYALRVGTTGDGTYAGSPGNGVNLRVQGCNFDGGAVYIDNIYGVDFRGNYHEQPSVYTYTGAALVLGAAGPGYMRNVYVGYNWFTNFDYAIDVPDTVPGLTIDPNSYASIKYVPVRIWKCETQTFKHRTGLPLGATITGGGRPEVQTNYSSGISITQLTFASMQLEGDWLANGAQVAPSQAAITSWYPNGMTNDGWKNVSSAYGRFRSGVAVQTGIAGVQAGQVFTFTNPADAVKFNGGDRITSGAGGASFVMSVNTSTGTVILDSTYNGATTISHTPVMLLGAVLYGNGSPNGVVTATTGSLYVNLAGAETNTLWLKTTTTGNTGWVAK